jgi:hypothetical protein
MTDPLPSHQLGNFRLERVLGRGGDRQVYYGWDVKLQRPVAVKVIFGSVVIRLCQRFVRSTSCILAA